MGEAMIWFSLEVIRFCGFLIPKSDYRLHDLVALKLMSTLFDHKTPESVKGLPQYLIYVELSKQASGSPTN